MENQEIKIRKTQRDYLLNRIKKESSNEKNTLLSLSLLKEKLEDANFYNDEELLPKYIELNSIVSLKTSFGFKYGLRVVLPEDGDIQHFRLSVLSALGCAIFGRKEGDSVKWYYEGKEEFLEVIKVTNEQQ